MTRLSAGARRMRRAKAAPRFKVATSSASFRKPPSKRIGAVGSALRRRTVPRDLGRSTQVLIDKPWPSGGARPISPVRVGTTWNCTSTRPSPSVSAKPPLSITFEASTPERNSSHCTPWRAARKPRSWPKQADRPARPAIDRDAQMVVEIAADAGQVAHHVDAGLGQVRGRADAGEHQDLGRGQACRPRGSLPRARARSFRRRPWCGRRCRPPGRSRP